LWHEKKFPRALLFFGPSGVGKTTVARIVAVSVQCKHVKGIGEPCLACRKDKSFPIYELNASKETGRDAVEEFISGSDYDPLTEGTRKVYILDEMHKFSDSAQNLLLKYLEKEDSNVLWILCTTRPEKVLNTLRQRCRSFKFQNLSLEAVKDLVTRLLKKLGSELSAEPLVDELFENRITSGRLIANAVDNYVSGDSPEDAVLVDIDAETKTKPLCRSVVKGDWAGASAILKKAGKSEAKFLRAGVLGYLQEVILNQEDLSDRTSGVAKAMALLTVPVAFDDQSQFAALCSNLYSLCKIFSARSL
jgi:DNA polymerase-3 subunit gamma/tau